MSQHHYVSEAVPAIPPVHKHERTTAENRPDKGHPSDGVVQGCHSFLDGFLAASGHATHDEQQWQVAENGVGSTATDSLGGGDCKPCVIGSHNNSSDSGLPA